MKKKVYRPVSLHTCDSASRSKSSPCGKTSERLARDKGRGGHLPMGIPHNLVGGGVVLNEVCCSTGSLTQGWSGREEGGKADVSPTFQTIWLVSDLPGEAVVRLEVPANTFLRGSSVSRQRLLTRSDTRLDLYVPRMKAGLMLWPQSGCS